MWRFFRECVLHRPCPHGQRVHAGHGQRGRGSRWPQRNQTSVPTSHQAGRAPAGPEFNVLASWCFWIIQKFQLTSRNWSSKWRSCKHCSSLVQWRSQKSSNAVSVSSSWPSSLMEKAIWFMHAFVGIFHIITSIYSIFYLCTVAKFSTSSWVMLYSVSVQRGSLMQSNRRLPWDSATCRSSYKLKQHWKKRK